MRVRVGVRHGLVSPLGGYRPRPEEAPAYARRMRPNASEAAALFESDWQGREIEAPVEGVLSLIVILDHVGMIAERGRLGRNRNGWAAVIHLTRDELWDGAAERSIAEIAGLLDERMRAVLDQVGLLPPSEDTGRNHGPRPQR